MSADRTEHRWQRHEWPRGENTFSPWAVLVRKSPDDPAGIGEPFHTADVEIHEFRLCAGGSGYETFLTGDVKWDGCSNWWQPTERSGDSVLHFCGRGGFGEFAKVMAWAHELAQALISASGTQCEGSS